MDLWLKDFNLDPNPWNLSFCDLLEVFLLLEDHLSCLLPLLSGNHLPQFLPTWQELVVAFNSAML